MKTVKQHFLEYVLNCSNYDELTDKESYDLCISCYDQALKKRKEKEFIKKEFGKQFI